MSCGPHGCDQTRKERGRDCKEKYECLHECECVKDVLEGLHARTKLSEVFKFTLRCVSADQKSMKIYPPRVEWIHLRELIVEA